jgi:predicted ATPase
VYEAELHRTRGELLISVRDFEGAEASFREAIAVARRQNAKLWELRAAMSMARLWRDQGKRIRPAIFSLRCTAGLPKASTRAI